MTFHAKRLLSSLVLIMGLGFPLAAQAVELVMVEQKGCAHCTRWHRELGAIYPKTSAGQFAPLHVTEISAPPPEGVSYARRVNFTPTFILIDNGTELGRIEGYPGEDFFWGLLEKMLADNTEFELPG